MAGKRELGIYRQGCRCGERLRAKAGGGESLAHTGGAGEGHTEGEGSGEEARAL